MTVLQPERLVSDTKRSRRDSRDQGVNLELCPWCSVGSVGSVGLAQRGKFGVDRCPGFGVARRVE